MAWAGARASVFENLRGPMIRRDQDVRERFVVAQKYIEARPQPFDQIGFEQQRFRLGAGDDEFKRTRRRDHPFDAGVETRRARVGADPVFDVLGLAHIEDVAARIDHAIDAGLRGRELGVTQNGLAPGGKRVATGAVGYRRL